jgi:hypothetical protein
MNEHQHDDGAEAVEAALRAWGEANIPDGFDDSLRSFDELMKAVHAVPKPRLVAVTERADHADLGADAIQLGSEFLEQGNFEKSEQWFRCAIRYGVPEAEAKLADLLELREALLEIRERYEQQGEVIERHSVWLRGLDAESDPYVEARRIIAQAEKQAAQIVTAARARARSTKSQAATSDVLHGASARSCTVQFPRGLDVDVLRVGVGAVGGSIAHIVGRTLTESTVDSTYLRKLAKFMGSSRRDPWWDVVMFCSVCEPWQLRDTYFRDSYPFATGGYPLATRVRRTRDVDFAWAAGSEFNASLSVVLRDLLVRHLGRDWMDEVCSRVIHQMGWPRKLPYGLQAADALSRQLEQPALKELLLAR